MSLLQFNEAQHLYTLDSIPITGVTTILGVIAKPALINWAANQAVDYVLGVGTLKDEDWILVSKEELNEARKAHTRRTDKAADVGTLAHAWVEKYINGENPAREEVLAPMTDSFVEWAKENQVEFQAAEKRVYSRKHWYAGTLDFLCKIGEQYYLGDFKTSSGIYDEFFFQTSAYQLALQEMEPTTPIHGHIIVNCRKDGGFEVRESYDYKKNIKAFLGALAIYKRKNEMKKDGKNLFK